MHPVFASGSKPTLPVTEIAGTSKPAEQKDGLFSQILQQANQDQQVADTAVKDLVKGDTDNVQQVVMAVAKAELSFQLFMEIRNHLIDSYNELMRMQF